MFKFAISKLAWATEQKCPPLSYIFPIPSGGIPYPQAPDSTMGIASPSLSPRATAKVNRHGCADACRGGTRNIGAPLHRAHIETSVPAT